MSFSNIKHPCSLISQVAFEILSSVFCLVCSKIFLVSCIFQLDSLNVHLHDSLIHLNYIPLASCGEEMGTQNHVFPSEHIWWKRIYHRQDMHGAKGTVPQVGDSEFTVPFHSEKTRG